jgi:hypothetical protein
VIPSAYLRVFRPLDTFPDVERGRWERYILDGGTPVRPLPVYRYASPDGEGAVGLLAPAEGDDADVRLAEGRYYVCPWRTRARVLAGIISLRENVPADVVETFVSEGEVRRAARELTRLRRREASTGPAILQSAWHVPTLWFALVDDGERRLVEGPDGRYRLSYWAPISQAKRRVERALLVLRHHEFGLASESLREMGQWLTRFDPGSRVELDYGELAAMFSWDELDNDHSGRDIQSAVEALAEPTGAEQAGALYLAVTNRWAEVRARETLN